MKRLSSFVISAAAFAIIFAATPVFADQAAWISRAEAARAMKVLAEATAIKHHCAPCDDQTIRDESVDNIGIFRVEGQNYWEIRVNGKGVDLAYVFFQKKGKWVNAAMQAKIDVSDVPKRLSRAQLGN
ncbi:MAG: hypothetical protein IPM21_00570 [Acidobacteria bacterium]|nr:hypothetical protein [Acidobacteriota bacterium]